MKILVGLDGIYLLYVIFGFFIVQIIVKKALEGNVAETADWTITLEKATLFERDDFHLDSSWLDRSAWGPGESSKRLFDYDSWDQSEPEIPIGRSVYRSRIRREFGQIRSDGLKGFGRILRDSGIRTSSLLSLTLGTVRMPVLFFEWALGDRSRRRILATRHEGLFPFELEMAIGTYEESACLDRAFL